MNDQPDPRDVSALAQYFTTAVRYVRRQGLSFKQIDELTRICENAELPTVHTLIEAHRLSIEEARRAHQQMSDDDGE